MRTQEGSLDLGDGPSFRGCSFFVNQFEWASKTTTNILSFCLGFSWSSSLEVFWDAGRASATPLEQKWRIWDTPEERSHTVSQHRRAMAGLWYAVPTLVIIGKSFPLSPHGEAECQVSIHTHTRPLPQVFFACLLRRRNRLCCQSVRVSIFGF